LAESHTALVGGLCTWLSVTVAIGGLGLTLRALEARRGRLRMDTFQGLYDHTPNLAACFALTGLASVGFPGTFGFIGNELLVDGSVEAQPVVGICLVAVAAMNGIAIMQAFLRLFGGAAYFSSVSLGLRRREQWAVLTLAALILVGGLFPQWIVAARNEAADELTQRVHQGAPPAHAKRRPFPAPANQPLGHEQASPANMRAELSITLAPNPVSSAASSP
jgi:NADH-quinone oxidoreductase subunit M